MRIFLLVISALIAAGLLAPQACNAREIVRLAGYSPGTIIVKTNERRLYFIIGNGNAIRYPVGVGRAGKTWSGTAYIAGK